MKIEHVAGPTEPFIVEGLRFYQQRCARCRALLDLGRIFPLPRFAEGTTVVREQSLTPRNALGSDTEEGVVYVSYSVQRYHRAANEDVPTPCSHAAADDAG